MLAAHPAIHSFPETHLIRDTVGDSSRREYGLSSHSLRSWPRQLGRRLRVAMGITEPGGACRRMRGLLEDVGRQDLFAAYPSRPRLLGRTIARQMAILDQLALDAGCERWVEKTPHHVLYTREIERYVPGARILHIVRKPQDNIASIYDAAHQNPGPFADELRTIEGCTRVWTNCYRATQRDQGRPGHSIISYENLTQDPHGTIGEICQHLGLTFDEAMVGDRSDVAGRIVRERESHKAGLTGGITPRSEKFAKVFTDQQQQYILGLLGAALDDGGELAWTPARLGGATPDVVRS